MDFLKAIAAVASEHGTEVGLLLMLLYMIMGFRAVRREIRASREEFKADLARTDERAKDDRERNEKEHARLFEAVGRLSEAVGGVQASVQVLLDRSERSGAPRE